MKVIFLDIDGVMNSQVFYHNRYKKRWFKFNTYKYWIISRVKWVFNGFKYKAVSLANYKPNPKQKTFEYQLSRLIEETDKQKWKWLSEFCNQNDYYICISSTWRFNFEDPRSWHAALANLGFKSRLYWGITPRLKGVRGDEIKWFLNNYPNITAYAILDDGSDMLPEQMNSFFLVDGYYGLTPNILYRVKRHLDKNDPKPLP